MKKQHVVACQSLGTSPSPAGEGVGGPTSNYQDKGWSSERVPHPSGSTCRSISRRRRHISALATPFNSGRQLPSKWEDAERWICSPVLGYGTVAKSSYSHSSYQRRPKSKSGPILPPGVASSFESGGGSVRNFLVNGSSSPFTTGVFIPNGVTRGNNIGCGVGGGGGVVNVGRSASLPCWSDLISESSLPSSGDEKLDDINDAENTVSRVISRRDMATQMSPKSSSNASPRRRSSSPPSILPIVESKSDHNAKLEIREVQVDNTATMISWSRRHGSCLTMKALPDIDDFSRNARDSCSWDISEAASEISKLQREEAKITAWENLQKAKAEAARWKLEMKLEKKRSSSMDKILNRLRSAQSKAQEMRKSITVKEGLQTPKRLPSITCSRKYSRLCSLHSCFTWHAF